MYEFKNKEILFLGAHPDDIEIGCLGLIYQLSELGCNITFCICTSEGSRKAEFNKSVDAFAGATISPNAVYTGLMRALKAYETGVSK